MSMPRHPAPHSPVDSSGPMFARIALFLIVISAACLPASSPAQTPTTSSGKNASAFRALQEGRVDDAAGLLHSALVTNPLDSEAHQLLCRVFYAQDLADEAIRQCELAASSAANDNEASDS